jgi:hypothetical protein
MLRTSCCAALLLVSGIAIGQTEFSADVVNHERGNDKATKVYFGKDKMRFDGAGDDRAGSGSFIVDLKSESYMILMDKQRMYMEMPAKMMESRGVFHFFQSGDVENACTEWLKQAKNTGGTCHKVGSDTVNGRNTVKYEGTDSSGAKSTVWLDSKLRFPVKWEEKNGGGEMRNIQEGPQPASLFEVPAGFTKMDMGKMMQQQ